MKVRIERQITCLELNTISQWCVENFDFATGRIVLNGGDKTQLLSETQNLLAATDKFNGKSRLRRTYYFASKDDNLAMLFKMKFG